MSDSSEAGRKKCRLGGAWNSGRGQLSRGVGAEPRGVWPGELDTKKPVEGSQFKANGTLPVSRSRLADSIVTQGRPNQSSRLGKRGGGPPTSQICCANSSSWPSPTSCRGR